MSHKIAGPSTRRVARIGPCSAGLTMSTRKFNRLSDDGTVPERTTSVSDQRRRFDRAIWVGLGRTPNPDHELPTMVVEFVAASKRDHTRDYEQKCGEYLDAGVVEYWVIDRFQRKMAIYVKAENQVVERVVLEASSLETPLLPGFVLPLAKRLGRADLWPAKNLPRKPSA